MRAPTFRPGLSRSAASSVVARMRPEVAPIPALAEPVPLSTPMIFTSAGSSAIRLWWWNTGVSPALALSTTISIWSSATPRMLTHCEVLPCPPPNWTPVSSRSVSRRLTAVERAMVLLVTGARALLLPCTFTVSNSLLSANAGSAKVKASGSSASLKIRICCFSIKFLPSLGSGGASCRAAGAIMPISAHKCKDW